MRSRLILAWVACGVLLAVPPPGHAQAPAPDAPALPGPERITFDEAVARALQRNPNVREAAQQILRAQALFQQARAAVLPTLYAGAGTVVLDAARGFDGQVTQPRTQSAFNATLSVPVLAASSWAEKNRLRRPGQDREHLRGGDAAAGRVHGGAGLPRRDRGPAAAGDRAAQPRHGPGPRGVRDGAPRGRQGQPPQPRALDAGARLGRGPAARDRARDPPGRGGAGRRRLRRRPEGRRGRPGAATGGAPVERRVAGGAARRSPLHGPGSRPPTASRARPGRSGSRPLDASFTPAVRHAGGSLRAGRTWRAVFQLQLPIYDGALVATRRLHVADRESARIRLDALKAAGALRAAARAGVRARSEQIVGHEPARPRRAPARPCASPRSPTGRARRSNIEVVQAQQSARHAEVELAVAEDRLRQARLDLLLALGQFPQ